MCWGYIPKTPEFEEKQSNRFSQLGAYLDFAGSFDSAWSEKILEKLLQAQTPSYLISLVDSFLHGRTV